MATTALNVLNAQCGKCKGSLAASVLSAAHDNKLLEVQVRCLGKCNKRIWTTFIALKDMVQL